jgi:hypothetical protein
VEQIFRRQHQGCGFQVLSLEISLAPKPSLNLMIYLLAFKLKLKIFKYEEAQ